MPHGSDPFGPSRTSASSVSGLGFVVLPRSIRFSKSRAGSSEKTSLLTNGTMKQRQGGMLTVTQNQGRVEEWSRAWIPWCSASILVQPHQIDLDGMRSEVMHGNYIAGQNGPLYLVPSSINRVCLHGETTGVNIIHSRFQPLRRTHSTTFGKVLTSMYSRWYAEVKGRNSVAG